MSDTDDSRISLLEIDAPALTPNPLEPIPLEELAAQRVADHADQIAQRATPAPVTRAPRLAPVPTTASVVPDLAAIAGESVHNAAAQGAGSIAGGQLAGVGYTTAAGYITAIRNGVTARTHASYITTLRARFGFTSVAIAVLGLPGPQLGQDAAPGQMAPIPADSPSMQMRGAMIAGAAAEGHGVLLGFSGRGTLTRAQLLQALADAGVPQDWAPAVKSAHAQAGRVLSALNSSGFVVRADRSKSKLRAQAAQGATVPTWSARWHVSVSTRGAEVGGTAGTVVMVATLIDDQLTISSSDLPLETRVRTEFAAAVAGEVYAAADVTAWLQATLRHRLRAARLGGTWYVRQAHAAAAERLIATLSLLWGEDFLLPALPIATTDQLCDGLLASFGREVDVVTDELHILTTTAKLESKLVSPASAQRLHSQLDKLSERAAGYAAMLGPARLAQLRTRLVDASHAIQEHMTGIEIRFGLIFDGLAEDAARATSC